MIPDHLYWASYKAVCGFDVRLDHFPIALEAAHIKWHTDGAPMRRSMVWHFARFTISYLIGGRSPLQMI